MSGNVYIKHMLQYFSSWLWQRTCVSFYTSPADELIYFFEMIILFSLLFLYVF